MKKMLLVLAAAAAALGACSEQDGGAVSGEMPVAIDPTIANPALTPRNAATRATDTDFEMNDAVGLTITMTGDRSLFAENRKMTFNGTAFAAAGFEWYADVMLTSTMFVYYPYREGEHAPAEFAVQADQTGDGYAASDLIVAVKSGVRPTVSATPMTFKHKMTRIVVDVNNESGSDVTGISIEDIVLTGVIDAETGAFTARAGDTPGKVQTYAAIADKLYYAMLVPQNGVRLRIAASTADGKTRTYTMGMTDLKSGENRRLEMNVQPADITVAFGGPIDGFEEGDELLPDGEGEVDVPSVEWGGVKYPVVTLKDGRTWMARNLRYLPAGKSAEEDFTQYGDGIWYPLTPSYSEADSKYVGVVSKDEAVLRQNGYLYSLAAAMGVDAVTEQNSATFEGKQGICPDGWHIPSKAEFDALIAAYPLPDNASKASTADLEKAGFPCTLTGMRAQNTSIITGSVSGTCFGDHIMAGYLMSSTRNSYSVNSSTQAITSQNKVFMIMSNATNRNALVSNASNWGGVPVRCIKNKE